MTYYEIMGVLNTIETLLKDWNYAYDKHIEAAEAIVNLHNAYCTACNLKDDYIYFNTDCVSHKELIKLLKLNNLGGIIYVCYLFKMP